jgi:hypothetical protein
VGVVKLSDHGRAGNGAEGIELVEPMRGEFAAATSVTVVLDILVAGADACAEQPNRARPGPRAGEGSCAPTLRLGGSPTDRPQMLGRVAQIAKDRLLADLHHYAGSTKADIDIGVAWGERWLGEV